MTLLYEEVKKMKGEIKRSLSLFMVLIMIFSGAITVLSEDNMEANLSSVIKKEDGAKPTVAEEVYRDKQEEEQVEAIDIEQNEELSETIVDTDLTELKLSETVEGVTVEVSGNLPLGARLSVIAIDEEETEEYLQELREDGIDFGEAFAFDITLLNGNDEEIQPASEVTVSFAGIEFSDGFEEILVCHVEYEKSRFKEGGTK